MIPVYDLFFHMVSHIPIPITYNWHTEHLVALVAKGQGTIVSAGDIALIVGELGA
jgi:hypothetical protein